MKSARIIARNYVVLVGAQVVTWALTLLLVVFLSRYLGDSATGRFYLADSLWAIAAMFMNFGMDTLLVKEVARTEARTSELFGTTLGLRCLLGLVGFVLVGVYVSSAGYPRETIAVVYIIGIASFISQCGEACRAFLQGEERMEYIALGAIASKAFMTVVSIGLLLRGHGLLAVASVTIGSALVYLLTQLLPLRRLHGLRLQYDRRLGAWLLKASLPYFATSMFLVAYQRVDAVIISLLVNDAAVGWYSAASKVSGALLFIPVLFVTVLFPALARMHGEAPELQRWLMRKSFHWLLLLGVPIGLGLVVVSDSLVLLLFGDGFARSGLVLAVMGGAMMFTYQNILMGQFLISTDRQHVLTILTGLALVAAIALDVVLVPWSQRIFQNGAVGGALSHGVTEAAVFVAGCRLLPRGTFDRALARAYCRVLLAGFVMAAIAWWSRHMFIAIPIAAGAFTYGGILFLLRSGPGEDWQALKELAKDALGRTNIWKPSVEWQA